jgi:hypothetical protein
VIHARPRPIYSADVVKCVFLAKDANFPTDAILNDNPNERALLSGYLTNPENFFRDNHLVHHPFLHQDWRIKSHDGGRYHQRLRKLLQKANVSADSISILEMLRLPTTGNSGRCALFRRAVAAQIPNPNAQIEHLRLLNDVLREQTKRVFVFGGFLGLWKSFSEAQRKVLIKHAPLLDSLATWLAKPDDNRNAIPDGIAARIHLHTHLSNAISDRELGEMAKIIAG